LRITFSPLQAGWRPAAAGAERGQGHDDLYRHRPVILDVNPVILVYFPLILETRTI